MSEAIAPSTEPSAGQSGAVASGSGSPIGSGSPAPLAPAAGFASAVTAAPAASPAEAVAHFTARLAFETDVSDVAADLAAGVPGVVVVDTRDGRGWDQGHVLGAVHIPTRDIAARAPDLIGRDVTVVVHCWGPGCNGATKAALEFARLGYAVKEMIGGFEYWAREGLPVQTGSGEVVRHAPDPLTGPVVGAACAC
ncbi:Rhodanese-related sulfurtransferase [Thermomonospora echinospora]|uniref:Rhodanese-related sulfurtransferase n=1 Tax=Thermomonospora echinospora TaxID=1992 RepID=A0A1H6CS68_9ACTN|nr:rhodanese-like domain-containing protein [Thermomonospora echinospora]SEG75627.1 Rhodanese-related sulfurtransferase [Thermomonospora echinospora]